MLQGYLHTARQAAALGADIIKGAMGKPIDVTLKARADQVTQVDLAIEEAIVELIQRQHPEHAIVAEEKHSSLNLLCESDCLVWVLDPLDGTSNFIHGWPMCAVSIALLQNGRPLVGVVRHGIWPEEFWAVRQCGAWFNGVKMNASKCRMLSQALCATAFPFRKRQLMPPYLNLFAQLFEQVEDVRRGGSAALDLAYVAAGRIDAYWEVGLKPWDIAAGQLLVQEAGGLISDFSGTDAFLLRGDVLAAGPALHHQLCALTSPWWRDNMKAEDAGPC